MLASDPQLAPGTVVLGEIRVESVVCVSGVGALHRARSTSSNVPLLVRAMSSASLKQAADAFAREVLVVRHLEHEGIVAPLDAGVEGDVASVAYEPVNGEVLQTLLGKSVPLSEVARITTELAAILDHAHRQPAPLIHGALSTSSIVLSGAARSVRLLDLGIVQALDRAQVLSDAMWDLLDPAAAAPEQVSRTFPIAPATDIFGLASIAYECLTGKPAFPATNAAEAQALLVAGKRPSARDVRHELNAEVDRLFAKAWSVDPRSRPHEIIPFASALAAALLRPPGAVADPIQANIEFTDDDEAETVNLPGSVLTKLEMPARVSPPKPQRAQTLPFGLPKTGTSDAPPNDRPTVPKMMTASDFAPPKSVRPANAATVAPAPVQSADPEVRTVRVVSVTGLFVSLIIAGSVIIAGAFVGVGSLVAERAARVASAHPIAAPTPTPAATPTPTPAATPEPPPPAPSPAPPATSEAVVAALAVNGTWPDLAKEPGPRPSAKALEAMRQRLKVAFEPCLKIPPRAPQGIPWMVHFEFDAATGQAVLVDVSRPFKGTLGGACMLRAALDARVPPFDGSRWAIDLRFGP